MELLRGLIHIIIKYSDSDHTDLLATSESIEIIDTSQAPSATPTPEPTPEPTPVLASTLNNGDTASGKIAVRNEEDLFLLDA